MIGRALQVGQVWEHWSSKRRLLIANFEVGPGYVWCEVRPGVRTLRNIDHILREYIYIGTLGQ